MPSSRPCSACGSRFMPKAPNQALCRPHCSRVRSGDRNAARTTRRATHALDFIGVDGEGVNIDGEHRYVLLGIGEHSLHRDEEHLDVLDIFVFLWSNFNVEKTYVGYFLGYDFTQWLRTLPEDRAWYLLHKQGIAKRQRTLSGGNTVPFPVYFGDWEFDMLGTKRFKLRYNPAHVKGEGAPAWMYINDAGPFFQSSFLKAVDPDSWPTPICTSEEYELIKAGKELRADARLDENMIRYNVTENTVLSRLMTTLNDGFVSGAGVQLGRDQWYGPGPAAQQWMSNAGIQRSHTRLVRNQPVLGVYDMVPDYVWDAAQATYYGGWFEILAHGIVPGTSYEYDINSAYPHILTQLPCLSHGTWERGTGALGRNCALPYLMVDATLSAPENSRIGPAPHRTKEGKILRPLKTRGWHWWHEVQAAKRAGSIKSIKVHEWIGYTPCDCPRPFAGIADLYLERLRVSKESPQGKAMKLVYNSCYGKNAQSIGTPKFANPVYASLITSGCRTMILDAIATHPTGQRDLLMVATDGVYFRTPHTALDLDDERLGAWGKKEKENLTLFMPGVYWDDESRRRIAKQESIKVKSRGISAADLAPKIAEIDRMWPEVTATSTWPTLDIPVNFNMTTAVQALHRGDWDSAGHVSNDDVRTISADPKLKRIWLWEDPWHDDGDYLASLPWLEFPGQLQSAPYEERFGRALEDANIDWDFVTPDDPSGRISLREMLMG